jgi:hypothetical protein
MVSLLRSSVEKRRVSTVHDGHIANSRKPVYMDIQQNPKGSRPTAQLDYSKSEVAFDPGVEYGSRFPG